MWRNADVLDFVGWLRNHNEHRHSHRVGFYGLDLYSLHASIRAVLDFLDKVDPDAARGLGDVWGASRLCGSPRRRLRSARLSGRKLHHPTRRNLSWQQALRGIQDRGCATARRRTSSRARDRRIGRDRWRRVPGRVVRTLAKGIPCSQLSNREPPCVIPSGRSRNLR
jgi:hypothetical protein